MIERTNNPIKDAERYYSDMEDAPDKTYLATIELKITVPVLAKNNYEAELESERVSEDIRNAIFCLNGDYEVTDIDEMGVMWEETE